MEYHVRETTIEALTRVLIETPSPVSYYEEIHPLMRRLAEKYGHTLTYDRKRAAYIQVEGEDTAKTVCVGAHLDTIGLMVHHINNNGTLALCNLGGINCNSIEDCNVQMHTRDGSTITGLLACTSRSIHVSGDARSAIREESNMMVIPDEPVHGSDEVYALGIEYGDIVSIDPDYRFTKSDFIRSRSIDDRTTVAAAFVVLEGLQKTDRKPQYITLFTFPLCEEIGHDGAYLPQEVGEYIALDIGLIGPGYCGSETKVSICAKDNYTPYDRAPTTKLIHLVRSQKLDCSMDVFYHYGTGTSAVIHVGNDVYAAAFGMGCSASHDMERCHIQSAVQAAKLLYAYLLSK